MSETPSNQGEKSEAANAGERSLQQLREQFVTPRHVYDVPENNAVSQREPAAITTAEETPPQEQLSEQVKDLVQNVDALVERIHAEEHKRQNAISAIETELKDSDDTDNPHCGRTYSKPMSASPVLSLRMAAAHPSTALI